MSVGRTSVVVEPDDADDAVVVMALIAAGVALTEGAVALVDVDGLAAGAGVASVMNASVDGSFVGALVLRGCWERGDDSAAAAG